MKKYSLIRISAFLLLALTSCEDFLDKNPESDLTSDQIYSDYERYNGVIDRIYGLVHNYTYSHFDYGNEIGTYSDEAQQAHNRWGYGRMVMDQVNTGNWLNSVCPGFAWRMNPGGEGVGDEGTGSEGEFHYRKWRVEVHGEAVVGIRAANIAIENIGLLEKYPDESVYTEQELKEHILGQAYFMRAWFYFMIIRDYGGMINMQESFSTDFEFDQVRPEYWESSEWAIQDIDSAILYLPDRWFVPTELGRVTKTSAKALKQMMLLYQASPNMNIPRDQSLGFNGTPEYNAETLERAVAAGVDALESALDPASRYRLYDQSEYSDAFFVKQTDNKHISDEAIFQATIGPEGGGTGLVGKEAGTGFYLPWFDGSYDWCGYAVPTHNAVEWFETADGWELDDAVANGSAWDPQDPYSNRDPRLNRFIFCHGDKMYLTDVTVPTMTDLGMGLRLDAREGYGHYAAEYEFGSNFTGYYHAGKFRWPGNNKYDNAFDNNGYMQIWSHIRFAQLYLDLAEAANELYGPTGSIPNSGLIDVTNAVEAINVVRNRIGMPDVQAMYYASKEAFREYIRMERARELYSEQHRWWDIRRWRIAKEVLAEGIWAADIKDDGFGGAIYGKQLTEFPRVFEDKHYWYPFQESDIFLFENFEQNPGW